MAKTTFQEFSATLKQIYQNLTPEDVCYFLGEYHRGVGYQGPGLNNAIQNLKKPMDRKGRPEWSYKNSAIANFAWKILNTKLYQVELSQYVWVPIPPSAAKSDPMYDDRLVQILECLRTQNKHLIFHEILASTKSRIPMHHPQGHRLTKEQLVGQWTLTMPPDLPENPTFVIFDDVITLGTTYRAAKEMLLQAYPQSKIVGVFLARTKLNDEDYLLNVDASDFGWTFDAPDKDKN